MINYSTTMTSVDVNFVAWVLSNFFNLSSNSDVCHAYGVLDPDIFS